MKDMSVGTLRWRCAYHVTERGSIIYGSVIVLMLVVNTYRWTYITPPPNLLLLPFHFKLLALLHGVPID